MKTFILASLLTLAIAAPPAKQVTVAGVPAVLSAPNSKFHVDAVSCSQGQYLSYSIQTSPFSGTTLAAAQAKLEKWVNSAPGTLTASSGSGSVGAKRTWTSVDSSLGETTSNQDTLTSVSLPSSGNSNLEQKWTTGQTKFNNGQTFYVSYNDLTVSGNAQGQLSLQYYLNVCGSAQNSATYSTMGKILTDGLQFWIGEIRG